VEPKESKPGKEFVGKHVVRLGEGGKKRGSHASLRYSIACYVR